MSTQMHDQEATRVVYPAASVIAPALLRQLNAMTDLDALLGRLLKLSLEVTEADRGSIFVLDESGGVAHKILARPGQTPEFATYNVLKVMKDGLGGWVCANRQPALLRDVSQDPRWVILPQDQWETGSAMAIPFLFQGRVSAMVIVQHEAKGSFDTPHLERLREVTELMATALEKARLIHKMTAERDALFGILERVAQPLLLVSDADQITFLNEIAAAYFTGSPTACAVEVLPEGEGLLQAIRMFRGEDPPLPQLKVRTAWPGRGTLKMSVRDVPPLGLLVTFLE
ncbi:MAG: GAF domain-containing protein [Magnetococcales bacterium]|nr:GAF domain-containing protein [Magnetococcales bacterium]